MASLTPAQIAALTSTQIAAMEVADLAETTHDPLLAQLRYRLRKHHGAARSGRMGVACVFSREAVAPPDASCALEAGDGQALLDALADCPVDVVLSDIRMPGLDGFGLVRALREREEKLRLALWASSEMYWQYDLERRELESIKIEPGHSDDLIERLGLRPHINFVSGVSDERIVELYQAHGVHIDRVLIKIASTWEGIQAAARLEREGIHTNLTLLFSFAQAVACGQAGVRLISPFVGRIYDWHKKSAGAAWDEAAMAGANDPGVRSVQRIYHHYKKHGIATEVMGASFRNVGQITALAGCDLLTISPELLAQLAASDAPLPRALDPQTARAMDIPFVTHDEAGFRFALNEDAMATEKLAEGIRAFVADTLKLEALMRG